MFRLVFLLLVLVLGGCGRGNPAEVTQVAETPAIKRNPKIPVELSYPTIDSWEDWNNKRRSVSYRLNMKVPEEVLREIAMEFKATETRQFERTLVSFYLPQFDPAAMKKKWASANFDPALKVEVIGLSIADEAKLRKLVIDKTGMILGPWLWEGFQSGEIRLIFEEGGNVKLGNCYEGGDRFNSDLDEIPCQSGRRFKLKNGNDQYHVDERGTLRVYGHENNLLSATPRMGKE